MTNNESPIPTMGVETSGTQSGIPQQYVPGTVTQQAPQQHPQPQEFGQPITSEQIITPRTDVIETSDELVVIVELPGFTEDDIILEGINQRLQIIAEREAEYGEEDKLHMCERTVRAERIIDLPLPVDIDEADAMIENGICRITIPKLEEMRRHRIGIH